MSSYGHLGLERLERRLGPRTRGRAASIALGAVLGLAGVGLGVLLHVVTSGASYAQLVGAVALAMVLGGVSAAVAATVVGWGVGAFLLENPDWQPVFFDRDEFLRWSTSLLAAAVVVGVGWTMRRGHERAAVAAVEAERSRRRLEAIQELTASLSAAVRPADVAEALAVGVVEALGARSGSFGLVEGADLVVVESGDGTGRAGTSPVRMALGSTDAARRGRPPGSRRLGRAACGARARVSRRALARRRERPRGPRPPRRGRDRRDGVRVPRAGCGHARATRGRDARRRARRAGAGAGAALRARALRGRADRPPAVCSPRRLRRASCPRTWRRSCASRGSAPPARTRSRSTSSRRAARRSSSRARAASRRPGSSRSPACRSSGTAPSRRRSRADGRRSIRLSGRSRRTIRCA